MPKNTPLQSLARYIDGLKRRRVRDVQDPMEKCSPRHLPVSAFRPATTYRLPWFIINDLVGAWSKVPFLDRHRRVQLDGPMQVIDGTTAIVRVRLGYGSPEHYLVWSSDQQYFLRWLSGDEVDEIEKWNRRHLARWLESGPGDGQ